MTQEESSRSGVDMRKELSWMSKQVQQVQIGAETLQQELDAMEIEGQSGEVVVVLSGNYEPRKVIIGNDAARRNPEELSLVVLAAMMDAWRQASTMREERISLLTGYSDLKKLLDLNG